MPCRTNYQRVSVQIAWAMGSGVAGCDPTWRNVRVDGFQIKSKTRADGDKRNLRRTRQVVCLGVCVLEIKSRAAKKQSVLAPPKGVEAGEGNQKPLFANPPHHLNSVTSRFEIA